MFDAIVVRDATIVNPDGAHGSTPCIDKTSFFVDYVTDQRSGPDHGIEAGIAFTFQIIRGTPGTFPVFVSSEEESL